MKSYFIGKIQRSLFIKLLLVVMITGILINFLVFASYRILFSAYAKPAFKKNITRYVNDLVKDMGTPPDPLRAKTLSKELFIQIRYESRDFSWATSEQLPPIQQLESSYWDPHTKMGWYRGRFFIVVDGGQGRFLFASDFRQYVSVPGGFMLVLILFLTLILTGAYLSIRRILKPIKWLTEGVDQVSKGNLNPQIPARRKDELGELANSFNSMTRQIREMIRAKEQLLLDISHELRSPITRAKVALEFVPEGATKESIREDLLEMETMITEILESERLNSSPGKLHLKMSNISEVIREVSQDFQSRPPGVKLASVPEEVFLEIDVERVKTVLKNILENSIKYSKPESQPIEIYVEDQEKSVWIRIQDEGFGIPEGELPFVFEPFYRVDRSRSKDTGGYGLGMSLCKKIMEAHGGTIEIRSTLNVGTTVFLRFVR